MTLHLICSLLHRRHPCRQHELLHAPGFDFAHDDLVGIAAVHHVDDLEAGRQLAGMAELADGVPSSSAL